MRESYKEEYLDNDIKHAQEMQEWITFSKLIETNEGQIEIQVEWTSDSISEFCIVCAGRQIKITFSEYEILKYMIEKLLDEVSIKIAKVIKL